MSLPLTSASAGNSTGPTTKNWILGTRPGNQSAVIARRFRAHPVGGKSTGIYKVVTADANRMAARLRQTAGLDYAEADVKAVDLGYPDDLLWEKQTWLNQIVNTSDVTPPAVDHTSPTLGLIEESIDKNHPDLQRADLKHAVSRDVVSDSHGTAVAAIAGSPGEGAGIRGVWPGMSMRQFHSGSSCSTASAAVLKAARARVSVINMSYGFPNHSCYSHYLATEMAVKKGVVPVASAGNTFGTGGNVPMRPATDPHVISVSSVDSGNHVAPFATRNNKVDITAPGEDVLAPVIYTKLGADGTSGRTYGWGMVSGTSFSTPMVAAAATWLRQVKPSLDYSQVNRLLLDSATDLGRAGRDRRYGNGLLNIGQALVGDTPPRDAREPNDDIDWINGRLLPRKAKFIWKGNRDRKKAVTATLSRYKDPADVYKIKIPPRRKVLITVAQFQGDVRLKVFKPTTRTINRPRHKLIVKSNRPAPKTEGVKIRNLKRKRRTVYVSVTPSRRDRAQYAYYRLKVRPRR